MRNAKLQLFHVSGKNFKGNENFQGNVYLKPEKSPEDSRFFIVNNVMSPYDLYDILSVFSFFVSKFSNLSIVMIKIHLFAFHNCFDAAYTQAILTV